MSFVFDGRPAESPLIDYIWRTQSESPGTFISQAETQSELVITRYQGKTTITVRGPETVASPAPIPEDAEFFGIVFKMGTFMPHLLAKNLLNRRDLTLPEVTNQSFWLLGSAWQFPTYDNADVFINRLVRDGLLVHDPVVDAVLGGHPLDLSLRAAQYRFVRATGITHKIVQQIKRAKQAATLLQQGQSILDTAYELGYFDQSHLTNSLRRFMGQTPAQIARLDDPE